MRGRGTEAERKQNYDDWSFSNGTISVLVGTTLMWLACSALDTGSTNQIRTTRKTTYPSITVKFIQ